MPSVAMSSRRTVVSASGNTISLVSMVSGFTRTRQLPPLQATQTVPWPSTLMP